MDDAVVDIYRKALDVLRDASGGDEKAAVRFTGYEREEGEGKVLFLAHGKERADAPTQIAKKGDKVAVVVDETPFYAESGGQVGDKGEIRTQAGARIRVQDTQKPLAGLVVHLGEVLEGEVSVGDTVQLEVDHALRTATRRNHSATHLLHWALRKTVGESATQKGSLVGPDRLRFDYSSGKPLTPDEIQRIEDLVNEKVLSDAPDPHRGAPAGRGEEARRDGDLRGEVRRRRARAHDDERLRRAVRRNACALARRDRHVQGALGQRHRRRRAPHRGGDGHERARVRPAARGRDQERVAPREGRAERAAREDRAAHRRHEEARKGARRGEAEARVRRRRRRRGGGGSSAAAASTTWPRRRGSSRSARCSPRRSTCPTARCCASSRRRSATSWGTPSCSSARSTAPKAQLVCTVSKSLTGKLKAGDLIRPIAQILGGSGGGRPDMAQAGGTDIAKIDEALEKLYALVS